MLEVPKGIWVECSTRASSAKCGGDVRRPAGADLDKQAARNPDVVESGLDSGLLERRLPSRVELAIRSVAGTFVRVRPSVSKEKAVNAREDEIAVPAIP